MKTYITWTTTGKVPDPGFWEGELDVMRNGQAFALSDFRLLATECLIRLGEPESPLDSRRNTIQYVEAVKVK